MKTINELIHEAYETGKSKGWHDPGMEKSIGDDIALMHSELSEAFEEHRAGWLPTQIYYQTGVVVQPPLPGSTDPQVFKVQMLAEDMKKAGVTPDGKKPEGIPIELADVLIRVFDFCGKHGIDLEAAVLEKMAFNRTRPVRHGGKKL